MHFRKGYNFVVYFVELYISGMNPFEDFLKAVRTSMARKLEAQISLPSDIIDPANALSAKYYSGVPTASLREYLQSAAEREDYALCALIQDELNMRTA
ncbi:hypothetical protein D770_18460 [Flammeovirgaceae bacterium 311]|nr:hypothetical protein D770_18460 [Flammeovirgaceae bacterium 311]